SHNLTTARWVSSPVSMPLEHDRRAVLRLDDRPKVGSERPGLALPARVVGATKPTPDRPLAAPIGQVEVLLPAAFELDVPSFGVSEADSIERLESHAVNLPSRGLHRSLRGILAAGSPMHL